MFCSGIEVGVNIPGHRLGGQEWGSGVESGEVRGDGGNSGYVGAEQCDGEVVSVDVVRDF